MAYSTACSHALPNDAHFSAHAAVPQDVQMQHKEMLMKDKDEFAVYAVKAVQRSDEEGPCLSGGSSV
jgi:hypothetical protein